MERLHCRGLHCREIDFLCIIAFSYFLISALTGPTYVRTDTPCLTTWKEAEASDTRTAEAANIFYQLKYYLTNIRKRYWCVQMLLLMFSVKVQQKRSTFEAFETLHASSEPDDIDSQAPDRKMVDNVIHST